MVIFHGCVSLPESDTAYWLHPIPISCESRETRKASMLFAAREEPKVGVIYWKSLEDAEGKHTENH